MNPPVYECGRIGTGTQLVVETFSNDLYLAFMMRSKHNMSKSVNNIIREQNSIKFRQTEIVENRSVPVPMQFPAAPNRRRTAELV
jgi:hypothetical protein